MQAAAKSKPTLPGVLGLWVFALVCLWLADLLIASNGAEFPIGGALGVLVGLVGLARFAKSLNDLDAVRDNWRAARGFKQRSTAHGTARKGIAKDAEKSGLLGEHGLMLGKIGTAVLRYAGESSIHIFAPARVGKSLMIMLWLVTWVPKPRWRGDDWRGSVVVNDEKGELYACTAWIQRSLFGRRVIALNPWREEMEEALDLEIGDTGYTGLEDLDPNSRDVIADVEAKMMLLIADSKDAKTDYFKKAGRAAGTVHSLGLLAIEGEVTLPRLQEKVLLTGEEAKAWFVEMQSSDAFGGWLRAKAARLWELRIEAGDQYQGGFDELCQALSIYESFGSLGQHCSRSEFRAEWLTEEPTAVYILRPNRYADSHSGYPNWVLATTIEAVARTKTTKRVLFVIDEAVRLGRIQNLDKAVELYASCISVVCAWQTVAAGIGVYGRDGFRKLVANADVVISRAQRDVTDLKETVELMGNETILDASRGINVTEQTADYRADHKGKPVLDLNDIRTLPADHQIVRHKNDPLYVVEAINPLKDPKWRERLAPNPYYQK